VKKLPQQIKTEGPGEDLTPNFITEIRRLTCLQNILTNQSKIGYTTSTIHYDRKVRKISGGGKIG